MTPEQADYVLKSHPFQYVELDVKKSGDVWVTIRYFGWEIHTFKSFKRAMGYTWEERTPILNTIVYRKL